MHEFESSASDSAFERYTGRVSHMDTRQASLGCLSVRMRFILFILLDYEISVIWTFEPFYLWLLFTNRRLKLHLRVRLWLIEAIAHLFLVSIEYRLVIVVLCLFATMPSFLIFPPSSVKAIDSRYPLSHIICLPYVYCSFFPLLTPNCSNFCFRFVIPAYYIRQQRLTELLH